MTRFYREIAQDDLFHVYFEQGRLDLERFRGRTSLTFAEQAVEHFVRREFDVDDLDGVAVGQRADDGSYPVQVSDQSVAVRIRRRMVIVDDPLTCRGTANQGVPTYTLRSII